MTLFDKNIKDEKKTRSILKKESILKQKQLEKQRNRVFNEMIANEKKHKKAKKTSPDGAYISLEKINKIYDNHVQAVFDFNLNIKQHEFIVLVGPSGCGKSTTLRMIAGLEDITAGDLFIDGIYANDLHPKDRGIAMVFQSYALYPHMSVEGNMSFSLKIRKFATLKVDKNNNPILGINKKIIRTLKKQLKNLVEYKESILNDKNDEELNKIDGFINDIKQKIEYLIVTPVELYENKHMSKDEIKARVLQAANILQIEDYLDRKPKALSGGQCQRVALGRAIVRKAKVFLMDEPLSNLDAKLRVAMRSEIIKLHNSLNATTIYVTHDQTEAMTMATRIVVMNKGYVQQIATPVEIYNHPTNMFVATFIGSPAMNLLNVKYKNGFIKFEKGTEIKLNEKIDAKIRTFYANSLLKRKDDLVKLDMNFIERNNYIAKIKELNEDLENGAKNINISKIKDAITTLNDELRLCEEANGERVNIIKEIKEFSNININDGVDLIFGIRPEDIVKTTHCFDINEKSQIFKIKIEVAELLGHEYFAHTVFEGIDFVAKINTKHILSNGDLIDVVFDMSHMHLFDKVSENTII